MGRVEGGEVWAECGGHRGGGTQRESFLKEVHLVRIRRREGWIPGLEEGQYVWNEAEETCRQVREEEGLGPHSTGRK